MNPNTAELQLVTRTVEQVAHLQNKRLADGQAARIAEIALKPAVIATDRERWMDTTVRGLHTTYSGAVAHYRASARKWGAA
jgi:hypothetical protein